MPSFISTNWLCLSRFSSNEAWSFKSWSLTLLRATFFFYWPETSLSFNLIFYHIIEKKNILQQPYSLYYNLHENLHERSLSCDSRNWKNHAPGLLHYKHPGKLPTSCVVTVHNTLFASIKHLHILIYAAIHVTQDQSQ